MVAADQYTTVNNPTATLYTGQKIPLVGLGTWRGEKEKLVIAVETALRAGYRYDTVLCMQRLSTALVLGDEWPHCTTRSRIQYCKKVPLHGVVFLATLFENPCCAHALLGSQLCCYNSA